MSLVVSNIGFSIRDVAIDKFEGSDLFYHWYALSKEQSDRITPVYEVRMLLGEEPVFTALEPQFRDLYRDLLQEEIRSRTQGTKGPLLLSILAK